MSAVRPKLRTIVEQPLVTAALKKAKQEYPRIDEIFDGFKWVITRSPFQGSNALRAGDKLLGYVRRNVANKRARVPSVTVVYKVTENEISIEAVTIREE